MFEIYKNAPDRYITETPDNDKQENVNNLYQNDPEQSPQNLSEPLPKINNEPLQTQTTLKIPNEPESTQKLTLIDDELLNRFTIDKETDTSVLLLSTNLTLRSERLMYYFPIDFEKLTLDGLIDTGAPTSAISEQVLKIKLLALEAISDTVPAPNFQIIVANGQLETPTGTVCFTFGARYHVLKLHHNGSPTQPPNWTLFLRRSSTRSNNFS